MPANAVANVVDPDVNDAQVVPSCAVWVRFKTRDVCVPKRKTLGAWFHNVDSFAVAPEEENKNKE